MPILGGTLLERELAYAESRSAFSFANEAPNWNDLTGVSMSLTAPGRPFFIAAAFTCWTAGTDDVAIFIRILDVSAGGVEVARGVTSLLDTPAGGVTAQASYAQPFCQMRITGVASGTLKTYKVQALQDARQATPPTVTIYGDAGTTDKNAQWIRAWRA